LHEFELSFTSGCVLIKSMRLRRIGLPPGLGLLLLSALWAVGSLRADLFPHAGTDTLPHALGEAALFSFFAVAAACIAAARGLEFPRGRDAWGCAGIGLGLFLFPAALVACAQGELSTLDRVAAFSLTPVFAVVLEPHLQGSIPRLGKAALGAALTAVTGILCLFPLDIPGSFRAAMALLALLAASFAIAAANCIAVRLAFRLAGRSILPMAAQAAGATAICFAAAGALAPHAAWRWNELSYQLLGLLVIELPALFLLFWLMPRLAASRMTARFLLAPLLTIFVGMALEAPSLSVRAWLGTVLLAGGAGWLVFAPAETTEVAGLELRNTLTADSPRRPPPDG
jgi:drug/metabolite transporter (DMT)-like permease